MTSTSVLTAVAVVGAGALGVAYFAMPHSQATKPAEKAAATQPAPSNTSPSNNTIVATAPASTTPSTPPAAPPTDAAKPPADAAKSPAEAAKPTAWIGLPVISADGTTIGQVAATEPHSDGRSVVLQVKGGDGKTYNVSSAIATMQGRAVQVAATAAEIGKMIR